MAPPNPCMVWYVRVGSTTTVGAVLGAVEKSTVPRSLSLSVPSAVVIQTWAAVVAGTAAAAGVAHSPPPVAAAAATTAAVATRLADLVFHMKLSLRSQDSGTSWKVWAVSPAVQAHCWSCVPLLVERLVTSRHSLPLLRAVKV